MKKIEMKEYDKKKNWYVKDDYDNERNIDRMLYHCVIEDTAKKYLKGKDVLEAFGGVGMSSYRYLKAAKSLTLNDLDEGQIECAKINLKDFDNVIYKNEDFIELFKNETTLYDFFDFDGFTPLMGLTYDNLDKFVENLKDDAVGFHFTDCYQFIVSRNFRHMFKGLEEKFNFKFEAEVGSDIKQRCETYLRNLGKSFSEKTGGKFVLSKAWVRMNVARLVFLNENLHDGLDIEWYMTQQEVIDYQKRLRLKKKQHRTIFDL